MARSEPWKQKPRHTAHTTLVVVEGDTEKALLNHIKRICGRNCGTQLTIENTHGGSGEVVLEKAIRMHKPYDISACLYDADREATKKQNLYDADRFKIRRFVSVPCIEALLLETLEQRVPATTEECKRRLNEKVRGDSLTGISGFQKHFPQELLERKRKDIPLLDDLFRLVDRR